MRYIKTLFAAAAILSAASAYSQQMSQLTKAIFSAYEETLREDPKDYITLYRRAVEYYRLNMYANALDDVETAIKYTPAKDADLLMHEYSLMSDIYIQLEDNSKALEAVNKALTINPKSYSDLYRKGNIYLAMKDADNAYSTFQSMIRLKSRSQEAFFGMAKASALKGNTEEANQLLEEMKNVDSTSALTYCRIGEVYHDLGEMEKSVVNYLTAISLGDGIQRPFAGLEQVARENYDAFCRGFDFAESKNSGNSFMSYIRAAICANTGHLNDAYSAYHTLAQSEDVSASSLTRAARVCLSLNKLDEAKAYADKAISMQPTADAYLVKSAVELANNSPATALLFASKSYSAANPDTQSLMAMAKAAIAQGDAKAASDALNEAVLIDAEAVDALLLRAYVKRYMQNDNAGANSDLQRAANTQADRLPALAYRAIAQALSGKTLDGEATISNMLAKGETAEALAYAAVYYAQTGNADKAQEYRNKAEAAGYENLYLFDTDKTPYLSLSTKH